MTNDAGRAIAVVLLGVDLSIEPFITQALGRCSERRLSPSEVDAVLSDSDDAVVLIVPAPLVCDLPTSACRARVLAVAHRACVPALDELLCDDLIVVPFDRAELEFRINRLARTARGAVSGRARAHTPPDAHASPFDAISMSRAQRDLLAVLRLRTGRVVAREELAAAVGVRANGRALDAHVSRLRRRLSRACGDRASCPRIVSRRGAGYALDVPVDQPTRLSVDRPNPRAVDNSWILSGRMYCYTDFKL